MNRVMLPNVYLSYCVYIHKGRFCCSKLDYKMVINIQLFTEVQTPLGLCAPPQHIYEASWTSETSPEGPKSRSKPII